MSEHTEQVLETKINYWKNTDVHVRLAPMIGPGVNLFIIAPILRKSQGILSHFLTQFRSGCGLK